MAARTTGSVGSPKLPYSSSGGSPRPTPSTNRPPDSRSRVTVSLASFQGRRLGSGVTIGPSRSRSVARATAVSSTQGSAMRSRQAFTNARWSQTKNPSQPAASASAASPATVRASP
jgi:hypothetical protein